MSDLSWLNPTPHAIAVYASQTTVASGHATLATKRTLLLTWAGLPPAGSRQLCLAHSFDHLVGEQLQRIRNVQSNCSRSLEIDHQFELGWLIDWQVCRLGALEKPCCIDAGFAILVPDIRSVGTKP